MLTTNQLSYDSPRGLLFENVSISLDGQSGKRVAIVGRNGCGKSTLLRLLMGEIEPTQGSVSQANETIAYLVQDITFPDENQSISEYLHSKLEEDWMSYQVDIATEKVGLTAELLEQRLLNLSGGQRVRVALAELLMQDPTILLLDEPTNHLDTEGVAWLASFIQDFQGTVAFVSHDRAFINACATMIWEITAELNIEAYGCSYDKFLIERYERYEKRLSIAKFANREMEELEAWLAENANHPKYKFSATVAQKKKALERMEKKAEPAPIPDPRVHMKPLENKIDKGSLVNLKLKGKSFDGRTILKDFELKIEQGERLLIQGANGSGKSTLIHILANIDKDFDGEVKYREGLRIGYLGQFSNLDPDRSVLDEFGAKTSQEYTRGRSVLANYLFPADLIDTKIKFLSYGQKRRLEFAIMLCNQPDILFLDEPTNHLDIFLREDIENFLMDQKIAMVLISHDEYFLKKLKIHKKIRIHSA